MGGLGRNRKKTGNDRRFRLARRARDIASSAAFVVFCLVAGAPTARADGLADEAELHFQLGASRYQRGEFTEALEHFLLSNRLVPNRRVVFNIARSYEQLKHYADAHRYYVDARAGESDPQVLSNIEAAVARVAPNVAVLDVTTTPPGATIYINRRDLGSRGKAPRPLAVAPGKYRIIAELEGYEPATSEEVDAPLGAGVGVALTLKRIVGTVRVGVEGAPAAAVRVDDERAPPACTAPCDLDLPPGPHQLFFAREGFQAAPRSVIVVARKRTEATASLSPLVGTLVVSTDEPGAQVSIDGRTFGFTPAVIRDVPIGPRTIRVTLRGFTPESRQIVVQANAETKLPIIELEPVREVTAVSRYAEQIDDAPSSLSVVDGQELRAFGYPTIAEALRGQRGMTLSNDGVYPSASIRGLGQADDYGNRVLILSDGQTLNENLVNSSFIGPEARVDLHDIDRIELVRGPGSLLYGAAAFSGVVNLVTRPRDEPSHVHAGIGVYDDSIVHARAGFHYNLRPDRGAWASASVAQSAVLGGGLPPGDAEALQSASLSKEIVGGGTAGRVWWGPVTAQWFFHRHDQIVPVGLYQTQFGNPRVRVSDTRMMAELRFEPRLSKSLELLTRAHANRYVYRADYAFEESTSVEDLKGTWFGGEARLVYSPSSRLRITAGGEGQVHPQASLLGREVVDDTSTSYLEAEQPYNFGAGYAIIEGSPWPWLRASAGARVDVYSTFGPIVVPRGSIILKPREGGTLKLMSGRAFRAPSIYEQLYNDDGASEVPAVDPARGLTLEPESVYSGEIEYSQRFFQDWVALVGGYASYVQRIIGLVPDTPGSPLVRYANSGAPAVIAGGDVEIRREWRRGWMFSAMYGYQRAQVLDESVSNPRLVNAPQLLASLRGVAPIVPEMVQVGLRATLEAPRRIDVKSDATTRTEVIVDATVSGAIRRFGLRYTVGVYNIANRHNQVPVADAVTIRTIPQNGRTFLIDVEGTYP
jgi:outer membrane receptor protein involved in Fe transport